MMIEEIVELRFIASRRACASGLSWAWRLIGWVVGEIVMQIDPRATAEKQRSAVGYH
jgi:hypothetical protein